MPDNRMLVAASILSLGLLAPAAEGGVLVQTPPSPAPQQEEPDCRAEPDNGTEDGAAPAAPDASILDECGGVLAPPATADQEIVEEPTQGGETPVIRPPVAPPPAEE